MSRYELTPLDTQSLACIVVGWERTLGTYFAEIFKADETAEFDIPADSIGVDFDDVTDPETIAEFVRPYAQVPDDLAAMLRADAQRAGRCDAPTMVRLAAPVRTLSDGELTDLPCPF